MDLSLIHLRNPGNPRVRVGMDQSFAGSRGRLAPRGKVYFTGVDKESERTFINSFWKKGFRRDFTKDSGFSSSMAD